MDTYKNEEQFLKNKTFGASQTEKQMTTAFFFSHSRKVTFKKICGGIKKRLLGRSSLMKRELDFLDKF